jgi:glycosyltransferase involved in cell wall biosynthesis
VLAQNFKDYEYIIVDGLSTDKTLEIIKKYKKQVNKIISEPDTGIYEAMNKGIKAARGEYLLFLNADDVLLHENVLAIVQNKLIDYRVDILYGNTLSLDEKNGRGAIVCKGLMNKRKLFAGTVPHQAAFVARTAFSKVGCYDDTLRIAGDYDWFLRAILEYKCTYQFCDFVCAINYAGGVSSNPEFYSLGKREGQLVQRRYFNFLERKIYNNYVGRKIMSWCDDFIIFMKNNGFSS